MKTVDETIGKEVRAFCARIGVDPLLVQGAGGNVSWKDGDILWVKASGTWLAEAEAKNIFVPVNLAHLQQAIFKHDFSVTPKVLGSSVLRPSIETLLHALMPHRVVMHLHAVEILAYLVRENPFEAFKKLIGISVKWVGVNYFKPGAELAKAVFSQLEAYPSASVIFLKNHGVVIGGEDVDEIKKTIDLLSSRLEGNLLPASPFEAGVEPIADLKEMGYSLVKEGHLNRLATDPNFYIRLSRDWALYPDHIVFLGPQPIILNKPISIDNLNKIAANTPPLMFLIGNGVYVHERFTAAHAAQLECYYNVLLRQAEIVRLVSLNHIEISDLLNWDAEIYRQNILKNS